MAIQIRRDTAANWTSANPVLASGQPGYETDLRGLKFGDGTTAWASLAYFATAAVIADGDKGDIVVSSAGTVWVLDAAIKAALRDRSTHTGTQPVSTLSDLNSALNARRYRHDQVSSSDTWTVNHNLGFRPVCEVFSPGWVGVDAAILHTSDNQTVITFNSAQTGQAIFS